MKKTLLIASLLTSVLALAGTNGSVEFTNNTKSTVGKFTKEGIKDAITGSEFDTGLKGEIKVNDLFAAGFEIGNKNTFDNFTVSKDTLFKHGEPSVWFEVMKDGNYFKTTLKPHKVEKLTKGEGNGTIVAEDYLPESGDIYQNKETLYVLRPELELNLQKSLDDLTFKANVKSEFNVISKKITGVVVSPIDNSDDFSSMRKVEEDKHPTYVDPKLSFDFSASKGDLAGVKDATADVMVDFKNENLGFNRAGLALSGNYDLNKTTNVAVEAKVDYRNQDVKSLNEEILDKDNEGVKGYRKSNQLDGFASKNKKLDDARELINGFFGGDGSVNSSNISYKEFKEKVLDSDEDTVKAYYKDLQTYIVKFYEEVYNDKLNDALDRKLDLGRVNHSYALDTTYKLGDQLSLGSSAYLYHAYFSDTENLVNTVLGATLNADVDAFHFGTEVKGLAMEHISNQNVVSTLALRSKVDTSYKFNLADGLSLTPAISGDILVSKINGETSVKEDRISYPKQINASITPKVSLEYMKNGFCLGLNAESKYNFSTKRSLDEYFASREDSDRVTDNDSIENHSFGFINNVFKAGLKLGYNW